MLYKAEDYLKNDDFIDNFLGLVTDVFMNDETSDCKGRTLQEVADKVKSILLPSPQMDSELSQTEAEEIKQRINRSLGID